MLEIKNVTKVYRTKGGVDTKALDDVSIAFPETGLVFLLGKSGSGKSTLLNVCGGLDEPTSGEVIVKGKSSKSFSGSDFDSYRNTFVGFIFQEYNVLDEFNVEDNIALALELQGKPKDKEKIHKLLCDVELENFAKRKPNTLSGGQKQRIAIARALVKEPQIIMADEPTGALDSATGKQVFDTLKKLSETRLVIVVSHDREFAEIYGDRIVELKDGKILTDVTKTNVPPQTIDDNVTVIGGNTLNIKKGSKLNKDNIKAIQDFVLSCDGDVIITKGEKQIDSFKKANRMDDDGATETFGDTKSEDIRLRQYSKEDSKFIRSRLPAGKAIKIGASGLKLKPIRLIFTIFLSLIAFTMFGLFSTLMVYDGDSVAKNSFMESGYEFINLAKSYEYRETYNYNGGDETYKSYIPVKFTEKELDELTQKYGDSTFGFYAYKCNLDNVKVKSGKDGYYNAALSKFAYIVSSNTMRTKVTGEYPATADEICISSYLAEVMLNSNSEVYDPKTDDKGNVTYDAKIEFNAVQEIIGKNVALNLGGTRRAFKVTGIFESGSIPKKYDDLKAGNGTDGMLSYQFQEYISESVHQLALVSEDFYSTYSPYGIFYQDNYTGFFVNYFDWCQENLRGQYKSFYYDFYNDEWKESEHTVDRRLGNSVRVYGTGDNKLKSYFFGGADKTSLTGNELVLNIEDIKEIYNMPFKKYIKARFDAGDIEEFGATFPEKLKESDKTTDEWGNECYETDFGNFYSYADYERSYNERCLNILYNQFDNIISLYKRGRYYKYDSEGNDTVVMASTEERKNALNTILKVYNTFQPMELDVEINDTRTVTCTIVGFHEINIDGNSDDEGIYVSQSFADENLTIEKKSDDNRKCETNYVREDGTIYSGIYVEYDGTAGKTDAIFDIIGAKNKKANDVVYSINDPLYESIEMVNGMAETLSTVFLWVGVVFAAFAALLMFNFISVSIASKRKEIGILRAVGARGTDVFKIFFAESGIIVGICTVLSLIGTFLACWLLNGILKSEAGLEVTLFVFGFVSVGMMLGIAILVAFISTFLPVYFAARKKPVDSIRAL